MVGKTLGPKTHSDATGARHVLNTTRVPAHHTGHPHVASTAHLVQAEVRDRAFEYRVAVGGEHLFATEIHVDAPTSTSAPPPTYTPRTDPEPCPPNSPAA
ncbi:hypothetical protein ACWGR4_35785 [Embleya sp. NPDC055664]